MAGNIKIIEPEANYQKVSKAIIYNKEVDTLTLGVFVRILCLGKSWQLNVKGLASTLGVSADKIRSSFASLEKAGFLRRTRVQGENGRFTGWDYEISAVPFTDIAILPMSEKTELRKNRTSENRAQYKDNKEIENNLVNNPPTPQRPTLKLVAAYAKEQGAADPEGFADYYLRCQDANRWRTKSGKVVENWKLNVIQWLKYHKNETFPKPAQSMRQITDLKAFLQ